MTRSSTSTDAVHTRNPPQPKSLLSKFTNSFAAKQRNPVEHEIKLDEPFRQFFSGDAVTGAVVVNTTKPLRITHLVIRLHGFVKVVNNARLPGESIPYDENLLTSMRNRRGIEYYGNGFARLFEDEFILCGDGCLFGKYEFRFEMNVPPEGLPSSIDFEHGTISYLLSSTLTRPTTISPTLTCHRKLKFTGNVDIARFQPPKPRTVSLEAVSKRAKPRLRVMRRNTGLQNSKDSSSLGNGETSVNRGSSSSPRTVDVPPQSPVPSVISSVSAESSSLSASNTVARALPTADSNASTENLAFPGPSDKTITARTELLQGGCLPGDVLQIKVSIDHTKAIQTMQGIIVTIFRQGRIDTHPAIPLGPMNSGDRRQYEDYYPRSRTGLGGLSLSSAGSSRAFRQDLAQTVSPLIVDPHTLTTVVRTSIQMPDHVFPTITSVPGDMISFRYHVEVVIDLRGRLAGQDRFLPNFNIVDGPQHGYGDPKISKVEGVDGVSYMTTPGFNYLITDQIRRTRGVVFTTHEIIVGTRNSAGVRGKQKETNNNYNTLQSSSSQAYHEEEYAYADIDGGLDATAAPFDAAQYGVQPSFEHSVEASCNIRIPPPDIEESLDEKTRIRRAEERLLPSQPPQEEDVQYAASPSAPFAYDEEDFVQRYGFAAPAPAYEASAVDRRPLIQTNSLQEAQNGEMPNLAQDTDRREQEDVRLPANTSRPMSGASNHTQQAQLDNPNYTNDASALNSTNISTETGKSSAKLSGAVSNDAVPDKRQADHKPDSDADASESANEEGRSLAIEGISSLQSSRIASIDQQFRLISDATDHRQGTLLRPEPPG